ncbi:MAG: hypothetical protein IT342_23645 [Candidatus Melainabacteria bacterium]|nr:hypothetical protein [Candidatus Melainabacteria bacterium]
MRSEQPKSTEYLPFKEYELNNKEGSKDHLPRLEIIETAESPEDKEISRRMHDLESRYNVRFELSLTSDLGDQIRRPTLNELRGLEAAFEKSPVVSMQMRDLGDPALTLAFTKGDGFKYAQHQADQIRIVFYGLDKQRYGKVTDDPSGTGESSYEAFMLHELAHRSEARAGYPLNYTDMGRIKPTNSLGTQSETADLIETEDGRLYRPTREKDAQGNDIEVWRRSDK